MRIYEQVKESKEFLTQFIKQSISSAIITGSGLSSLEDILTDKVSINFRDIPHFSQTTVKGHPGRLVFGNIRHESVVLMLGRFHLYEGNTPAQVTFPIRLFKELGVKNIFLTNAAGGLNPQYRPGDVILIKDHLNLSGENPLVGPHHENDGPRFPDMSTAYSPHLREICQMTAKKMNYNLQEGIYCQVKGPNYETPAEVRMISTLGADLVGMSTVQEVLMAHYLGLKICAFSCVSNLAAGLSLQKLLHEDIESEVKKSLKVFKELLTNIIGQSTKIT